VWDLEDDRLSNLIERISEKRLGLNDVKPDIIGRSYEYLIRKFAEGSVSSAGEFYTPKEVGMLMARIINPEPGMEIYDPCCGSAGLLIKCELAFLETMSLRSRKTFPPLKLYGQEYIAGRLVPRTEICISTSSYYAWIETSGITLSFMSYYTFPSLIMESSGRA